MLRNAGVPIQENLQVLPEFFVFRFVIPPNTLYKNIFQLHPGDHLYLKIRDNKATLHKIFNYTPPKSNNTKNIKVITEQIIELLNYSIWD